MYSPVQIAKKYVHYFVSALNGKGHGVHSPFVYRFVRDVLNDKRHFYAYTHVEALRATLLNDKTMVEVQDLGAGSVSGARKKKSISMLARSSSKSPKYGQLLHRISNYFQPAVILELGTSLGISTAYLASGSPHSKLITCEGSEASAAIARKNFARLNLTNIQVKDGHFDHILPGLLQQHPILDLVFIDGNHRKEPTLRYFEMMKPNLNQDSVLIFDDIHWSAEMEAAWETIKADPMVTCTIELFFIGLVFFKPDFKVPQHFIIRF